MDVSNEVAATLRAQDHGHPPVICFEPGIAKREGGADRFVKDKCTTLRANMGDNQPAVCYEVQVHAVCYEISAGEAREGSTEVCQTLRSRMGTGGGNVPMILIER